MSDAGMGPLLAGFAKLKPKAGIALAELADASHRVELRPPELSRHRPTHGHRPNRRQRSRDPL